MKTKREIDSRVAANEDFSRATVTTVTAAFVHEIRRALVEEGEVSLPGLGTLRVFEVYGPQHQNLTPGKNTKRVGRQSQVSTLPAIKVSFTKASVFTKLLKENRNGRRHGKVRRR